MRERITESAAEIVYVEFLKTKNFSKFLDHIAYYSWKFGSGGGPCSGGFRNRQLFLNKLKSLIKKKDLKNVNF